MTGLSDSVESNQHDPVPAPGHGESCGSGPCVECYIENMHPLPDVPWHQPEGEWWEALDHEGYDLEWWTRGIGRRNDARDKLRALAPEMAEAILALAPIIEEECAPAFLAENPGSAEAVALAVAAKLRALTADQETTNG